MKKKTGTFEVTTEPQTFEGLATIRIDSRILHIEPLGDHRIKVWAEEAADGE